MPFYIARPRVIDNIQQDAGIITQLKVSVSSFFGCIGGTLAEVEQLRYCTDTVLLHREVGAALCRVDFIYN